MTSKLLLRYSFDLSKRRHIYIDREPAMINIFVTVGYYNNHQTIASDIVSHIGG